MDRALIEEKLESLRRCVRRIEAKRPDDVRRLEDNWDVQDILTLNITRAVQLCVDVAMHVAASGEVRSPDTMADAFDALHQMEVLPAGLTQRMKGAVGFRNIAIHEYKSVDWQIVHAICHQHLDDFRQFAQRVVRWMNEREA